MTGRWVADHADLIWAGFLVFVIVIFAVAIRIARRKDRQ